MKILSWNVRGLGNPQGIRTLRDVIVKEGPDILFFQETRLKTQAVENCKYKLGFTNCLAVDCVGKSGGIALF